MLEQRRRGRRLRLRQPVPAAAGLPLLPRGLGLPRAGQAPAAASAGCSWPSCSPAAKPAGARQMLAVIGDSANAGVDRRAPRARLRARRHDRARRLEVRPLARRRADAARLGPGRRDRRRRRRERPTGATRSQDVATWLAVLGGSLGLHRFYLHGARDALGLAAPAGRRWSAPTASGACAQLGIDDRSAACSSRCSARCSRRRMLAAIVYGLTPDERWARALRRRRRRAAPAGRPYIGVVVALAVGATALMATIAFAAQRYFELRARPLSRYGISQQAEPRRRRAATNADAGIVKIQAQTMLPATPQRTADGAPHRADADDRAGDRVRRRHRDAERRWRGTA